MTDQERKAMEMALEALDSCNFDYDNEERQVRTFDAPLVNAAHRALRQALAQPTKPWVGLDDNDFQYQTPQYVLTMKYAEAILKEKNK